MVDESKKMPGDNTVGYKMPPKKHQYPPGKSGNPTGRKKDEPVDSIRSLIDAVISETVQVQEGSRVRTMSNLEANIENLRRQALGGDVKAARNFFKHAAKAGMLEKMMIAKSFVRMIRPGGDDGKIIRMYEAEQEAGLDKTGKEGRRQSVELLSGRAQRRRPMNAPNDDDNSNGSKPGKNKVGPKHPPGHSRYKPGYSGNLKGRPENSPNFANLTRKAFNAKVAVKTGKKTVHMTSGEAIVRVLMKLSHQGNRSARSAYFEILNMTGRTADISDAERERRILKLPTPQSRDVFDLLTSPAMEAERHRLLARYRIEEAKGCAPQWDPKYIEGAPRPNLAREARRPGWREPDPEVVRLGLQAHERCFGGDFNEALSSADQAIAQAADLNVTWIQLVRAHACMMVGRIEEAHSFYLQFPNLPDLARAGKTLSFRTLKT